MIQSLEERIEKQKEDLNLIVDKEKKAQIIIDKIISLLPPGSEEFLSYTFLRLNPCLLTYATKDLDTLEMETIPRISEALDTKWIKEVTKEGVYYYATKKGDLSLSIFLSLSDSCVIKKINTGRKIQSSKYVRALEDEIIYEVSCGED